MSSLPDLLVIQIGVLILVGPNNTDLCSLVCWALGPEGVAEMFGKLVGCLVGLWG